MSSSLRRSDQRDYREPGVGGRHRILAARPTVKFFVSATRPQNWGNIADVSQAAVLRCAQQVQKRGGRRRPGGRPGWRRPAVCLPGSIGVNPAQAIPAVSYESELMRLAGGHGHEHCPMFTLTPRTVFLQPIRRSRFGKSDTQRGSH